jgi:hypothetical protein
MRGSSKDIAHSTRNSQKVTSIELGSQKESSRTDLNKTQKYGTASGKINSLSMTTEVSKVDQSLHHSSSSGFKKSVQPH